jgi:nicotinamide-nucleotide amidase
VTVAVTGIAGPGGGGADKPVGLVHFAAARRGKTLHKEIRFGDLGRGEVRRRSVLAAFDLLNKLIAAD